MGGAAATIRLLGAADEAALERFLVRHADSSMFLRSNARAYGLRDGGERLHGTYAAAFDGDQIAGVAAHYRSHVLVLQAPVVGAAAALASRAVAASGRPVGGLIGPLAQVMEARTALGLDGAGAAMESEEDLFALELSQMQVPAALADGRLVCRLPDGNDEMAQARAWRTAYAIEALGSTPGPDLDDEVRGSIAREVGRGDLWLLLDGERGRPLSMTATNARLPDMVSIGGVYTPPELRGRGHGRAVVAGQLVDVQRTGVRRAVLFTGRDNTPARRAYEGLGFRIVGDYALILFAL
jgi:ribosomal protein S18 acetylase RimI-like enzyme